MAQEDFVAQLKELGYQPEPLPEGRVAFPYLVPCGKFAGQQIRLGFAIPPDFSLSSPSGPHMSPRLLPLNPVQGEHPLAGVHTSPFGDEWEYWSRPMPNWSSTSKKVRDVMAHVRRLFDTQ